MYAKLLAPLPPRVYTLLGTKRQYSLFTSTMHKLLLFPLLASVAAVNLCTKGTRYPTAKREQRRKRQIQVYILLQ